MLLLFFILPIIYLEAASVPFCDRGALLPQDVAYCKSNGIPREYR